MNEWALNRKIELLIKTSQQRFESPKPLVYLLGTTTSSRSSPPTFNLFFYFYMSSYVLKLYYFLCFFPLNSYPWTCLSLSQIHGFLWIYIVHIHTYTHIYKYTYTYFESEQRGFPREDPPSLIIRYGVVSPIITYIWVQLCILRRLYLCLLLLLWLARSLLAKAWDQIATLWKWSYQIFEE